MNINAEEKPHKLEHFGISLIEGMLYGNYPIVYSIGGPVETVKLLNIGETFNNFEFNKYFYENN